MLEIEGENFAICNVTSASNLQAGFSVYYIVPSREYCEENEINSYMCVTKDEKIVFLDANQILYASTDEVEFLDKDGVWRMYILASMISKQYKGGNGVMTQEISQYLLEEGFFIYENTYMVYELENITEYDMVTMKKSGSNIDLYELERNDVFDVQYGLEGLEYNGTVPEYEEWSVGEKLATIKYK